MTAKECIQISKLETSFVTVDHYHSLVTQQSV